MEYINDGLMYPRGRDVDGKTVFIFRSKLYVRGTRNLDDLKKCFLYWIERIIREANDDLVTIVFDLTDAGLSNVDMDYTKYIINTFKNYYPCSLNYILIYDLPWILNGNCNASIVQMCHNVLTCCLLVPFQPPSKSSKSSCPPKPSTGYGTSAVKTFASTSMTTTCRGAGAARTITCFSSCRKGGNPWSYR